MSDKLYQSYGSQRWQECCFLRRTKCFLHKCFDLSWHDFCPNHLSLTSTSRNGILYYSVAKHCFFLIKESVVRERWLITLLIVSLLQIQLAEKLTLTIEVLLLLLCERNWNTSVWFYFFSCVAYTNDNERFLNCNEF